MTLHLKNVLSPDEMNFLRKIRRDYAQASKALADTGTLIAREAYEEVKERRSRAIRSLHDDGFTEREISAILMCSKNYVKAALNNV